MFKSIITLTLLATSTFAQLISIVSPPDGAVVFPGEHVNVTLQKPNSPSPSVEVAVVIALQSCANTPCTPSSDIIGTTLYNGAYDPQEYDYSRPAYQNITVTIPEGFPFGTAQLDVFHVNLIGGVNAPNYQLLNKTISVVNLK